MADRDYAPPRRFVTRQDVEDAHRAGRTITLGPLDVITHEAAARAVDLGVSVARPDRPQPRTWTGVAPRPSFVEPVERSRRGPESGDSPAAGTGAAGAASQRDLRRAVRAAIVAELGREPAGLDDTIDRVLTRRDR